MQDNTLPHHLQLPFHEAWRAISNELRQRLIDAHQSGVTYKQMTRLYGVKKDTAYRICSTRQYSTKLRGGPRGKKLDEDSISLLLITIEARPDITLGEMGNKLLLERGITVSISTIARCLEGCLITVKKLELLPSVRNSPANKECGRNHALWLQEQHEIVARFCYVDECGFGIYTARIVVDQCKDYQLEGLLTINELQCHTDMCYLSRCWTCTFKDPIGRC